MIDTIKRAFPQTEINGCLETRTETEFHIYDHETEKRCYVHTDSEGIKHFTVENVSGRPVHFLAIDKCLFFDNDGPKRCDCAIFDKETFCFIEIKTTSSMTQRKKLRREAKNQLKAAVTFFRENITFTSTQIEAYVSSLIDSQTRPLNRASLIDEIEEFEEIGVILFHNNRKKFE
ncbi:hypothetical protein [Spirosoma linguale]|uniref:Uncharacterized protein n=1 Tax=Spirosoma linguale (strain ATCC 33905 / DSM 74 / LMG 10896 / Claus 1) TaxID=504472 RepID=D2QIE6_SPILD|nr:hypothetical protein Slin_2714 [Spirosoma linguale DSM 74]